VTAQIEDTEVIDLTALEREGDPRTDRPRRRRRVTGDDYTAVVWAVIAGGAFTWTLRMVLGMHGILGTALWWYIGALVVFFMLVRDRLDGEAALDRVVTVLIWSVGGLVSAILVWMIAFLVVKGLPYLSTTFFTDDMSEVGPLSPGGGARHAIIGTLEQVGLATLVVVPVAVLTAVYLNEIDGRLAKPARFVIDAMSGLPSIIAGLLVYTVWVRDHGFSGVAGAAALAVLMLPTVTRASEEILRTIPDPLREGALALGAPRWQVTLRVVIPTALAGLVTAVILGIARAVGETAPMLLTAFGADTTNTNPFSGPQANLPLFVWKLIRLPNETQQNRAWAGVLLLVLLVLVLFVTARFIAARSQRKLSGR
jgi:phosphate transport system permease protein